MCEICLFLVYAFKYIFSETTTVKPKSETCDTFAKVFDDPSGDTDFLTRDWHGKLATY